jgi:hypothetical protein
MRTFFPFTLQVEGGRELTKRIISARGEAMKSMSRCEKKMIVRKDTKRVSREKGKKSVGEVGCGKEINGNRFIAIVPTILAFPPKLSPLRSFSHTLPLP